LLLLVRHVPGMCADADNPFVANTLVVASALLLLLVHDVTNMSAVAGVSSVALTPAVACVLIAVACPCVPSMCGVADNPFVAANTPFVAANTRAVASALLLLLVRDVPGMSAVAGTLSVTNLAPTTTSRQGTFIY
jgi:hypothetical protein